MSESPGVQLASALLLIALFFLPLADGGYSGAGYQLSFVLLPVAAAIALLSGPPLPRTALLAVLVVSASVALLPLWIQPGQLLWYYLLALPCSWVLTWTALSAASARARLILPAASLAGLLTAVYGLFLWLGSGRLDYFISSTFGLHNAYAGYLLLAWPAAAVAALQSEGRLKRWAFGLLSAVLAITLVLTYSKASIACLALQLLGLGGCLLWLRMRQALAAARSAALPVTLAGIGIAAIGLLALPTVRDALSRMTDFGGYSMQGRLRFWQAALEIFRDHPLLGVGPGNFAFVYPQYQKDWMYYSVDPHSWPLQLLAELGSLGALLILAVLAGTLLWIRKLQSTLRPQAAPAPAAVSPAQDSQLARRALTATLLTGAVLASLAHAAFDFDYTFAATTSLLGVLLAYGSYLSRQTDGAAAATEVPAALATGGLKPARLQAVVCGVLLLIAAGLGEALTLERFTLDNLRNQTMDVGARADMLRSAIRCNPYNFRTHYQLASLLAQPGMSAFSEGQADRREAALQEVKQSILLNPRYAQAWALSGLLSRDREQGEKDLEHAVELDPYNFPEHYFYWSSLAQDDAERLRRLELGMSRIPAEGPLQQDTIRPEWLKLNAMFGQVWQEMAKLSTVPRNKELYQRRADLFKEFLRKQAQAERDAAETE